MFVTSEEIFVTKKELRKRSFRKCVSICGRWGFTSEETLWNKVSDNDIKKEVRW